MNERLLLYFSQDEVQLVETILDALRHSSGLCLSLDELNQYTRIRKTLLSVYLSKMSEHGLIEKKRKNINGRRLMIYCLNI